MGKIEFKCEKCMKKFMEYKSNRVKKHIYCSKKCSDKTKVGNIPWNKGFGEYMMGDKNPAWKGERAGYTALHEWVKQRLGSPKECVACGNDKTVGWANISHLYKRDLKDWGQLCHKCHSLFDSGNNWGKGVKTWNVQNGDYKDRRIYT